LAITIWSLIEVVIEIVTSHAYMEGEVMPFVERDVMHDILIGA
jgi:hypothetical protein